MAVIKLEKKHYDFLESEFSIKNLAHLSPSQKEELFEELFEIEGAEINADENSIRGKIAAEIADYLHDVYYSTKTINQSQPLIKKALPAMG